MKREILAPLVIALCATLSSCGSPAAESATPEPETSEESILMYTETNVPMLENVLDVSYDSVTDLDEGACYYYRMSDLGTDGSFIGDYVDFLKEKGFSQTGDTTDTVIMMTNPDDDMLSLSVDTVATVGEGCFIVTVLY